MDFRDLRRQYYLLKEEIDQAIQSTLQSGKYISGPQVQELEYELAEYVGRKHCISCANGTDALELALRVMGIGNNDAVFVPDFTFFSSGEVVSTVGAIPVFVDVEDSTFNVSPKLLEEAIQMVIEDGKYLPKAIIAVDLFGQPADYDSILYLAKKYDLYVIEDGAQGFGGNINGKMACSFGDISTTSFFPAKPLGCYGDGGAIFTDSDVWNEKIRSYCVHGKSSNGKYDNVRIGMNSRLDSIQAAILSVKLKAFQEKEIVLVNEVARKYTEELVDIVKTPVVKESFLSSWAQYTIRLEDENERNWLQNYLRENGIPSMIYYVKPMHLQEAFDEVGCMYGEIENTKVLCKTVLSLPIFPYMTQDECEEVICKVRKGIDWYRKQ